MIDDMSAVIKRVKRKGGRCLEQEEFKSSNATREKRKANAEWTATAQRSIHSTSIAPRGEKRKRETCVEQEPHVN